MDSTEEILLAFIGVFVGTFLFITGCYRNPIELIKECLVLLNNKVRRVAERVSLGIYVRLTYACHKNNNHRQAIENGEKALAMCRDQGERKQEGELYNLLARVYHSLDDYLKAKEFHEKALLIRREIGDRKGEATEYGNLGDVYEFLGHYVKAKESLEKAIAIKREIGDRSGEGACYGNIGTVYRCLGDYVKAKEFIEKGLAIMIEIGDRKGEGADYGNLGIVYQSLGDYVKAKELHEKALGIKIEIGDRKGEGVGYGNLGTVYKSLGDYVTAKVFLEKALTIMIEIGHREGEGAEYNNLGTVYQSFGDYVKAKEFHEKALAIRIEIGDRRGEGACYGNLGTVYHSLGDFVKAKEFFEKALAIRIEIGDREGERTDYGNLASVYQSLGDYVKAKELHEKALAISIEIGDRRGEGLCYGNLGTVYVSLGDFVKAKEFFENALAIRIEIGDRKGEGTDYGNLASIYQSLGDYVKVKESLEKALAIRIEIGDRRGEGLCYSNLGTVYYCLGDYVKAKEFLEKGLAIRIEIGDRSGEAADYCKLGTVYKSLGSSGLVEDYYKKGLAIAIELGTVDIECDFQVRLAIWYVKMMKTKEALSCLFAAVERFEDLRGFLREHDQYKINFADGNSFPYYLLALMLCSKGEFAESLFVSELGRARALADLMSAQYSLKGLRTSNRVAYGDFEQIMPNGTSTCIILYICFAFEIMLFYIIKPDKKVLFKKININVHGSLLQDYVESLSNQSYRNLTVLLKTESEDRSLFTFYESDAKCQAQAEEKRASCRLVEENEEQEPALQSLYKMIISPVADCFEGSEIIICPEPSLYQVPFAALMDKDEKYLSETFRIRLIPSLTTLKLIQDSPADYHSQTGALIVGDPDVGRKNIPPLPCAREEAEMIGRLLHVQPLIGREATKQAVLQSMHSASLIHIAAHGDAKRGDIALAPLRPINRTPQKDDFMLTMSDVSEVQLRAKLVVLSCCHSGCGEIRTEGVIGIARAFLGSGARSVLVSLWAVSDRATKEFMCQFYEHLSRGESASESLHEAIKWMRGGPKYCAVREWAPFVLIGDNVAFNFEELTRDQRSKST